VLRVRPRNARETRGGGGICVQPLRAATVRMASHPEPHNFSFDYVAGDGTSQETIFRGGLGGCCIVPTVESHGAHFPISVLLSPQPAFLPLTACPTVAGKPIVDNCLGGYNGCIFAYGQTGSGVLAWLASTGRCTATGNAVGSLGAAVHFSSQHLMCRRCCCITAAGKTYTMLGSDETAGEWTGGPGRDEARGLIQRVFEHLFARMAEAGGKHLLECSFLEIYNEVRGLGGMAGGAAWVA